MLFSIYQFSTVYVILNNFQSALHIITSLWLPVPRKNYFNMTLKKLKTFRRSVPMNFHDTKKLFMIVTGGFP